MEVEGLELGQFFRKVTNSVLEAIELIKSSIRDELSRSPLSTATFPTRTSISNRRGDPANFVSNCSSLQK